MRGISHVGTDRLLDPEAIGAFVLQVVLNARLNDGSPTGGLDVALARVSPEQSLHPQLGRDDTMKRFELPERGARIVVAVSSNDSIAGRL